MLAFFFFLRARGVCVSRLFAACVWGLRCGSAVGFGPLLVFCGWVFCALVVVVGAFPAVLLFPAAFSRSRPVGAQKQ